MRIHDRYLLSLYVKTLLLGLLVFVLIFVIVDVFENIDDFIDYDAPLTYIIELYAFQIPYIVLMVLPVAGLLATLFTLGRLSRNMEITALLSSGQSLLRIATPVLIFSFLMSGAALYLGETWVPKANEHYKFIENIKIKKQEEQNFETMRNFHYLGKGGRIILARKYETRIQTMFNVVVQEFDGNTLVRRIDARQANWNGRYWTFWNGSLRTFSGDEEKMETFERIAMTELSETPEDLATEAPDPEEMNFSQLLSFIRKVKSSGGEVEKFLVDLHLKISYPFSNFIIVLLGVGLTSAKRRASYAKGFGLTLVVAFAYYGIIRVGQALGHNSTIHPILAAWLGNLVFLAIGVAFFARANR